MKVISVVNQKGGCGKTTTAVNLAALLAKKGYRTLLIDLDPQAHASFTINAQSSLSSLDLLETTNEQVLFSPESCANPIENLFFISSSLGLAASEQRLSASENRLVLLKNRLEAVANDFDYCLIDCPPNLGLITLNALNASTFSVIPINLCAYSMRGVQLLKDIFIMLKEYSGCAPAPFYLLNNVDLRSRFSQRIYEEIKSRMGNMLLTTMIRANIALRESGAVSKTILDFNPKSRGAQDFTALAYEIEKITSRPGWASLFLKDSQAQEVYVVGDFNNWSKSEVYKMRRTGENILSINIPLEKGSYRYKFSCDGQFFADPINKMQEDDSFGGRHSVMFVE